MYDMKINDKNDEWIDKIPQNWGLRKIKYVLDPRNEKNTPLRSKKILSLTAKQGVIPYSQKEGGGNKPKQNLSNYKLAYPGDIVMNSMNILSGAVGISKYFGCVSPVYYMLTCRNKSDDIRFFYYVFANKTFQNSLLGIGNGILIKESENGKFNTIRMRIPIEKLENMCLPYPSPQIQKRITDYLDKKVTKINKISKTIQQEIDALEEYRKSLIIETVTKGLDKTVPMKDSGIEWIGEIPENWKIEKAKYSIEIDNGSDPIDDDGAVPVYGSGKKSFRTTSDFKVGPAVLLGRKGSISNPLWVENKYWNVDTAFDVKSNGKINLKYYYYCAMCFDYGFYTTQTALPSMTQTEYNNMHIPFPSLQEQSKLVEFLDKKSDRIDKILNQKHQQLTYLDKYKQSIIYEYVTGKKQVPEKEGVKNAQ